MRRQPESTGATAAAPNPEARSKGEVSSVRLPPDARRRVRIERITPEIDAGRWPAKRILGDPFRVEVDLVCDGHESVAGVLLYRPTGTTAWDEVRLEPLVNDRWHGTFELSQLGWWQYTVEAWTDEFATWRKLLDKKLEARQDVSLELQVGSEIVAQAARRASAQAGPELERVARILRSTRTARDTKIDAATDERLRELMAAYPDRSRSTWHDVVLEVRVDRPKARFSSWYELFPRSTTGSGNHGTFRDVESVLPYVASMGFDVVYFPPIHPIGTSHRKGRNNALVAEDGDPGSPWAIGDKTGGHKAVHPELGTLVDFRRLVAKAKDYGLEVALDAAFQTSPDHPYVTAHPEWFKKRPDGTIQYAENPPKKYEDIYPFDFDSRDWRGLWRELHSIFLFWIEQGVRLFRVDNPHTKPLRFWEWCIRDIQTRHPDVVFLAEAFTRPKLMYALAKAGFSQSYTYFTWRNTSRELTEYLQELTETDVGEFFRPNLWPNTPDILPEHLQFGGRAAFIARFVLAATLSSSYGIYGPAFELMAHVARPGSEEYLDNEKYEIKRWNLEDPNSLRPIITRVNRARRECAALQGNVNLRFHKTDNDQLLCFSKQTLDGQDSVIVVVNLDFYHRQSGWVELDLDALGMDSQETFQIHDLIAEARYLWRGPRNYVELEPQLVPAHVFQVRRFVQREQDFDYYA